MLKAHFVLSFQLCGICEIRHEILLATDYLSHKSGEDLVLDFGGLSDSNYCFLYVGRFLTLLFAIGNIAIWEGVMTHSSPPWICPFLY